MLKVKEAVIVEGKYDKIKLSSVIDGVIIVTNGFGIFKDKEKLELIRFYAKTTGIIILTDSDSAGRKIRGYIKSAVNNGNIKNVYIPDIFGKEKRKTKFSSERKIGVEGIDKKTLIEAFEKAGINCNNESTAKHDITPAIFYELGLTGGEYSSFLRLKLQKNLGLPSLMSTSSLIEVLNHIISCHELEELVYTLKTEENNGI